MPDIINCHRYAKLAVIVSTALLAGCHIEHTQDKTLEVVLDHTFDHANWRQGEPLIEPQVEPITFVHVMAFTSGEAQLTDEELARLRNFLQESGVHERARIEVDGPRAAGGYFDPLTKSRVEEIQTELSGLGLKSHIPVRSPTLLARPDDSIAVTVTRAMVIPPDCSTPQPSRATRPQYDWSCANAANLGTMVADPVDLVRGQTPSSADGEALARSIELYRKRDIEDPTAQKTSN